MNSYDINQLARLEPAYLSRYGLSSAPFPPTHEDRFLYLDAERKQRLNMLHHLTRYSSLLLIVSGDRGIGKTSLKQRFVAEAEKEWLVCQVDAHPMMDNQELLTRIAEGFGLLELPSAAEALQDSLFKYLNTLHHNEVIPVLLIDDAHELPQDALEAIFHLADIEAGDGNLLRTILFCEPEINTMLESPYIQPLRERITHSMEIPPLDEEHTADYLHHRLAVAGLQRHSPFSDKDIKRIYKTSQGIPERINEAAHMILSGEQYEIEEEPDEKTVFSYNPRHMLLGIVAATIIISVLIFQEQINALFNPAESQTQAEKMARPDPQPVPGTPVDIPGDAKTEAPPVKEATKADGADGELPELPFVSEYTPPDSSATKTPVPATKADPVPLEISRISPSPVSTSTKPQIITIHGKGFSTDSEVTLSWSGNSKTLKSDQLEYVSPEQLKLNIRVGTTADVWEVSIKNARNNSQAKSQFYVVAIPVKKETKPTATTQAKIQADIQAGPVVAPATRPESGPQVDTGLAWLEAQPPQNYSLQLLASYTRHSIVRFISEHKLDKNFAIIKTQSNNKAWYSLVYGSYASREEAELAVRQLPESMKTIRPEIKPWIRGFANILPRPTTPGKPSPTMPTDKPASVPANRIKQDSQTAWLWEQDPRHYTLQLLGGRNQAAIKDFIRKHQLKGKIATFRTIRDGKPWYALVYGSYPDRLQAQQAILQLPGELRKTTPWARSFASVHNDMYRN